MITLLKDIKTNSERIIKKKINFNSSDFKSIYIRKTINNTLNVLNLNDDEDNELDKDTKERYESEYDKNQGELITNVPNNECIYIIKNESSFKQIPEYILYHTNFINKFKDEEDDDDNSTNSDNDFTKLKNNIKKFNKKMIFIALLDIIANNKDNNNNNNANNNNETQNTFIAPIQYLLFEEDYLKKSIKQYPTKYRLEYREFDHFNDLDIRKYNKEDYKTLYEYEKDIEGEKGTTQIPDYFKNVIKDEEYLINKDKSSFNDFINSLNTIVKPFTEEEKRKEKEKGFSQYSKEYFEKYTQEKKLIIDFKKKTQNIIKKINEKIKNNCYIVNSKNFESA